MLRITKEADYGIMLLVAMSAFGEIAKELRLLLSLILGLMIQIGKDLPGPLA